MMHQNLLYLFTGIHWIEHKVSRWIHDWRFAHCTYNSEWRVPDFLFHFFSAPSFSKHHFADHNHQLGDLRTVWQCDILFLQLLWRLFFFLICFTSTICIETIHRLDTFLIRTFVPLLLTANTDQPHTLCLCNNNARIILIIRIIITLITVVINILFIHKSWQQIRHGDAHDSRTQNSKAVQKHEFVFTLRMSVCLHFWTAAPKAFFVSCTSYPPHTVASVVFF